MPTNKQKVLAVLATKPTQWICDACLSVSSHVYPVNQVNKICNKLKTTRQIQRQKTQCSSCPSKRECNRINLTSTFKSANELSAAEEPQRSRKAVPSVSPSTTLPTLPDVERYLLSLNGQVICDKCVADANNWDLNIVVQICGVLAQNPNPILRRSSSAGCNFRTGGACSGHIKSKVFPKFLHSDKSYNSIIRCFAATSGLPQRSSSAIATSMGDLEMVRVHVPQTITQKSLDVFLGELICDFIQIAGGSLTLGDFQIDPFSCPHATPNPLTSNQQAVYLFCDKDGIFLKIGQVGPNSNIRHLYQHYDPKAALSTLSKSILNDSFFPEGELVEVGPWMKQNLWRANIILDRKLTGVLVLNLLEAYLHVRFNPLYEKG